MLVTYSPLKILIVEDEGMFAQLLVDWCGSRLVGYLNSGFFQHDPAGLGPPQFKWVESCGAARNAIDQLRPDIVLIDVRLRDGDGIDLATEWAQTQRLTRFVGVSGLIDEWSVWRVSNSPLHGFVAKSKSGLYELCDIMMAVLRGERRFCTTYQATRARVMRNPACFAHLLNPRELEALSGVVEGLDDGELGERLGIRPATARKHRHNLMTKLGVESSPKLVAAGWRLGLGRRDTPSPF